MTDVKSALDRFYLSLSVLEIRNSSMFGEADRLPYNSVLYLDFISVCPGCTASDIAEAIGVTKATVSMTLSRLEEKGMIQRTRSESDGRVRHISLTERIQEPYSRYGDMVSSLVGEVAAEHTEEELETFVRILGEISAKLEGYRGPGDGS